MITVTLSVAESDAAAFFDALADLYVKFKGAVRQTAAAVAQPAPTTAPAEAPRTPFVVDDLVDAEKFNAFGDPATAPKKRGRKSNAEKAQADFAAPQTPATTEPSVPTVAAAFAQPAAPTSGPTLDMIRTLGTQLVQAGHSGKLVEFLKEFGALRYPDIPADKYTEAYAALQKLIGATVKAAA